MIHQLFPPADRPPRAAAPGAPAPWREEAQWRGPGPVESWQWLESRADLPTQSLAFYTALNSSLLGTSQTRLFADSDGMGLRAVLPLCRNRRWFARWRMIGSREVFEPMDALAMDDAARGDIARQLADQGRPLDFDRVPADSRFAVLLRGAMQGKALVRLRPAAACPYIALGCGWCEPESQYNSGRRSDFRRATRRAEELGAVTFEVLSPGEREFDALFDEAVAVELRSWKQEAGTAIGADRGKEAFFRHFLGNAAREGTLRIAFMRIGGRAVAMQLALEWHGRFWLFKIGFDEEYARCSPGTLLMLHTLGWAAGQNLHGYEMLGNVEPWIAEFWTREAHPCVRLRTYPFNLAGGLALLVDGLLGVFGYVQRFARSITKSRARSGQ